MVSLTEPRALVLTLEQKAPFLKEPRPCCWRRKGAQGELPHDFPALGLPTAELTHTTVSLLTRSLPPSTRVISHLLRRHSPKRLDFVLPLGLFLPRYKDYLNYHFQQSLDFVCLFLLIPHPTSLGVGAL